MKRKKIKMLMVVASVLIVLALFSGCCSTRTCTMLQEQTSQALSEAKAAREAAERAMSAARNASEKALLAEEKADAAAASAARADAAAQSAAKSAQKAEAAFMKNMGK